MKSKNTMVKKLASVVSLVTLVTITMAFAGCSSAPKQAETPAVAAQAPSSPVNLGAASSGRGI